MEGSQALIRLPLILRSKAESFFTTGNKKKKPVNTDGLSL